MSKKLLSLLGLALAVTSLGTIGCEAPLAEGRKSITSKLRAPDPMMKLEASAAAEHVTGVHQWRLYRGKGGVYLEGVDGSGRPVSGISTEVFARDRKNLPAAFGVQINDGGGTAALHDFEAAGTRVNHLPSQQSLDFVQAAMHDLTRAQVGLEQLAAGDSASSSGIKTQAVTTKTPAGSKAAQARLCARAMVASAQSSVMCTAGSPMSATTAAQCAQFKQIINVAGATCFNKATQNGLATGLSSANEVTQASCTSASCKAQVSVLDSLAKLLQSKPAGSGASAASKSGSTGSKAAGAKSGSKTGSSAGSKTGSGSSAGSKSGSNAGGSPVAAPKPAEPKAVAEAQGNLQKAGAVSQQNFNSFMSTAEAQKAVEAANGKGAAATGGFDASKDSIDTSKLTPGKEVRGDAENTDGMSQLIEDQRQGVESRAANEMESTNEAFMASQKEQGLDPALSGTFDNAEGSEAAFGGGDLGNEVTSSPPDTGIDPGLGGTFDNAEGSEAAFGAGDTSGTPTDAPLDQNPNTGEVSNGAGEDPGFGPGPVESSGSAGGDSAADPGVGGGSDGFSDAMPTDI